MLMPTGEQCCGAFSVGSQTCFGEVYP
jgi:hypothetical protein